MGNTLQDCSEGHTEWICMFLKALYGLKQAPREIEKINHLKRYSLVLLLY